LRSGSCGAPSAWEGRGSWSLLGGLALFAFGLGVVFWTYRENSFASSVVRVQEERDQRVIDTGPYAYVRHPMYAGIIPLFAGLGLLFGSTTMALAALPMVMIGFLPRVLIEEATLRKELPGYEDYMSRVQSRLVPGII
jgi:protein-S-isoprenylcysteine O-methyltransferase Ste14